MELERGVLTFRINGALLHKVDHGVPAGTQQLDPILPTSVQLALTRFKMPPAWTRDCRCWLDFAGACWHPGSACCRMLPLHAAAAVQLGPRFLGTGTMPLGIGPRLCGIGARPPLGISPRFCGIGARPLLGMGPRPLGCRARNPFPPPPPPPHLTESSSCSRWQKQHSRCAGV